MSARETELRKVEQELEALEAELDAVELLLKNLESTRHITPERWKTAQAVIARCLTGPYCLIQLRNFRSCNKLLSICMRDLAAIGLTLRRMLAERAAAETSGSGS